MSKSTSDKTLTTSPPFKFQTQEDITPESLNRLVEWLSSTIQDIETEEKLVDDEITSLKARVTVLEP